MSMPRELDDPLATPVDLPLRPSPPRTWRDRLDDLAAGLSPVRIVGGAGVLAVAAVVGWRMLAPPATPPEVSIPFTEQPAAEADEAGAGEPTDGASGRQPTGSTTATSVAGAGATDAATGAAGGEVVVHVVGAVALPGVHRLPAGARVVDAVDAAGGATPDADLGRVNLAAPLTDGQQVYVLRVGETPPPPAPTSTGGAGGAGGTTGTGAAGGASDAVINVNTASATELEELPGVGPATAEAIIAHREEHGPFASIDDLLDVRGIGEAKLEQIRDRATV
jgi:competence protein ComEA